MLLFYSYLIALSCITISLAVNDDALFASNKVSKCSNYLLIASILPAWIGGTIALAFVDNGVVFTIALLWTLILLIASVVSSFENRLFGVGSMVCFGSLLALLITTNNSYEAPHLSPDIVSGRYCAVDRESYCFPIQGQNERYTLSWGSEASFRTACHICGEKYSRHYHAQYTPTEYKAKLRSDSIFAEYMVPDLPY